MAKKPEKMVLPLTAEQYNELYIHAFVKLAEVLRVAEEGMKQLEELQLLMGDRVETLAKLRLIVPSEKTKKQT